MQTTLTKPASQPAQQPLDVPQLFSLVKALASSQSIIITAHARQRMSERHLNTQRLLDILLNPTKLVRVEYNEEHNSIKYKIKGGKHKRCVAINISNDNLIIITVM